MPPPRPRLEEKLSALKAMERSASLPDEKALEEALRSKTGLLVAAATSIVAAREVRSLLPELAPAFGRLCERPLERDPGCRGKIAIAKALHALDAWDDAVFVPGIRYVQQEPVWGGREDTAAPLRAECAMAFAHAGRAEALHVLADLLADPHRAARAAAAQAIGDAGRPDAAALLRYKVRIGDDEPDVLSACLGSLLVLEPRPSLAFVSGLLSGSGDLACAAALALGESRTAAAAPPLVAWCEAVTADVRGRVGYLALALLRDDAATGYLLERVRSAPREDALAAGRALATFRDDPRLAARVLEAAAGREPAVAAALAGSLARRP